jgi:phosphoglycerol transferase
MHIFLIVILNFLSIAIINTAYGINAMFGDSITADELIFVTLSGFEANKGVDPFILKFYFKRVFLPSVKITLILHILLYLIKKFLENEEFMSQPAQLFKKIFIKFYSLLFKKAVAFIFLLLSILFFLTHFGVLDLARKAMIKRAEEDYIANYYVEPNKNIKAPLNKKNLLVIYVESLETTFTRKDIFNENLIEAIDSIPGQNIKHFVQGSGASWTMAGMIASQCSLPLKPIYNKLAQATDLLTSAKCIGNILRENGYEQYYLVGSDEKFARTYDYYHSHGYQNIMGMNYWKSVGLSIDLFKGWGNGLHDDALLNQAKELIQKAVKSNKPFNFTIVTCDTHAPSGFPSSNCTQDEISSGLQGAYRCSSRFIAEFIKDLQKEHLLDNTIVLIMGDHLFMSTEENKDLFPEPRYVYAKFIHQNKNLKPLRDTINHFDIAPSLLELLGFSEISGEQFGLGFSVFSKADDKRYNKILELIKNKKFEGYSKRYEQFGIKK